MKWLIALAVIVGALVVVAVHDLVQSKHSLLRNYPIVGHLRYLLEKVGPELRQYIVTDNDEERPFSRDERRWVYASAKKQNPYFGFGTDSDLASPQHVLIRQAAFPYENSGATHDDTQLACLKVLGEWSGREKAFTPTSVVNISAMSFGSLSAPAIEALNRGAKAAGCLHNTGEGGISIHHKHGGELIYQLGTGYFGARDLKGRFSIDMLLTSIDSAPVRAIEIKLSQGAKPGLGGVLPGSGPLTPTTNRPVPLTTFRPFAMI